MTKGKVPLSKFWILAMWKKKKKSGKWLKNEKSVFHC